jgi:hypothetical protein
VFQRLFTAPGELGLGIALAAASITGMNRPSMAPSDQTPGRWFHDEGRAMAMPSSAAPSLDEPLAPGSTVREELHRLIDELPDEDVPLALELARRLLGELPQRPS